ncbi:MAG: NAD-dependent epimerase/dehydratase family protein [Actinomycetes bacterium]|jgi:nucleoside-diphosphate-sugar epimerase|nr:NAD-dependent epimerase/dehydratase family protein [Actinomycetes bacterium]
MSNLYTNRVIADDLRVVADSPDIADKLRGTTVMITGASGMLGLYCAFICLHLNDRFDAGIKVIALVRNQRKARQVFGDTANRSDLDLLVADVSDPIDYAGPLDYVIHAASQASPTYFEQDPVGTIKANTLGVINTLDLARDRHARGYLFVSTREIYGQPTAGTEWITEDDWGHVNPLDVRSCYSEGKRAGETIVVSYAHQYDVPVKIARLSHTYGPGMGIDDARVQAFFARSVLDGTDIVLKSTGQLQRTYTYVADAAAAIYHVLLKTDGVTYNIADTDSLVTIKELAETFIAARPDKHLNLQFDLSPDAARAGWSPVTGGNLDCSRLTATGWQAQFHLVDGVNRTLSFFESDSRGRG